MSIFIWPKSKVINLIKILNIKKQNSDIEDEIKKYYQGGFPVLCSSGRTSIMLILKLFMDNNERKVGIFPYASTCVREAIFKLANFSTLKESYNISYNQWGYQNAEKGKTFLIEDSADTLTEINTNIFQYTQSNFIIWSLPKILGTHTGALIWCREENDSILLKNTIQRNKPSSYKYHLILTYICLN